MKNEKLFIDFTKSEIRTNLASKSYSDFVKGIGKTIKTAIIFPIINEDGKEINHSIKLSIWGGTWISIYLRLTGVKIPNTNVLLNESLLYDNDLPLPLKQMKYDGDPIKDIIENASENKFINDFKLDVKDIQNKIKIGVENKLNKSVEFIGEFEQELYDNLIKSYASKYTFKVA